MKEHSGGPGLSCLADTITKLMPHASTAQIVEATGLSKHYVNMAKANPEGTSSFTTGKRHRKQRSDAYTWNCPEIEQLIAFFLTGEKTRCSPNRKDVWIDQSVSPERAYPVMLYWMKIEDLWLAYREWKARLTSIFAAQNDFFPDIKPGNDEEEEEEGEKEEECVPTKKEEKKSYPGVSLSIFRKVMLLFFYFPFNCAGKHVSNLLFCCLTFEVHATVAEKRQGRAVRVHDLSECH